MKYLLLKRLIMLVPTAIFVALISFSIIYFSPGDTAQLILRDKNPIGLPDDALVEEYERILGLDKPFPQLFSQWLKGAAVGDFGNSFKTGLPVTQEFRHRFLYTVKLVFLATCVYIFLGLLLGTLSAIYKDSIIDQFVRGFAAFNLSVPSFWLALFFLWLFSMKLKIFPAYGYQGFISLILPGFVMGLGRSSTLARLTRTCILEALDSPYVATARGIGLSETAILIKHVLKNILLPIVTLIGMNSISLLGGSVIIENIFGLPGVGSYLVQAINLKDFPIISGFIFIFGIIIVLINLLVDFSYVIIDPRVRYDENAYK
ncbi:ABC-type dipeptide/oligopeptide/nickel transport system, permease component [Clostridium aceticum]|uniref:ABC-type dipeptide/oligopeptide/nickel transport system, permease component n=1 Tax=Clostridium aceticum TaxID=84022 RepID=A0A0D8I8E7_9CLOT|nr:ABC transporter permease [Clostridium aceticum]AKL95888.1 ABC-type dipeptide/oligopeptide/nickel transport system, permease component [Clostridium aceticum]KJF26528.1 glutathione ABC transporter permease [Clostridium aceticum]